MFTGRDEINAPPARPLPQGGGAPEPTGGGVDLGVLLGYEGPREDGEPDLIVELLDLYLDNAPAKLAAMRAALVESDTTRLKYHAHYLKGSSANLGARRVAELCDELEGACRGDGLDGAGQTLERLARALGDARRVFEAERERRL